MKAKRFIWPLMAALLALTVSCRDPHFSADETGGTGSRTPGGRQPVEQTRNVMIMVSGGHNNLSSYLTADLKEMAEGFLPTGDYQTANVLMILSRLPQNGFSSTSVPVLYRLYRGADGEPVRDTIRVWGTEDRLFGGTVLSDALNMVRDRYPAKSYGVVLSSHASGWLPPGYYEKPSQYENGNTLSLRSIGQDKDGGVSVEMDLVDFAGAIPYKLDYLVLDCCLSGGVEVAWALRGKVDRVAFTQTETMAEGFDYSAIVRRLLGDYTPDPLGVCQDFYNYYIALSGVMQSATISLVDPNKMDALATVSAALFEKYRTPMSQLKGSQVQGYFRYSRHFFYDFRDILFEAGASEEEMARLDAALEDCVLYKAATPWFMKGGEDGFAINTHCGLSMYLPSMGTKFLDNYYKANIAWNQATQLVL